MPDTKISAETTGTTPAVGDEFRIARSGANYKLTWAQMHTFPNGIAVQGLTFGKGAGTIATNTAAGYQALNANTTGLRNVAVGYLALASNTTGGYNTASGYQALYSNTTANQNTASGYGALFANTTGGNNTASGVNALQANTTGSYNTANGFHALYSNTTGSSNTAIGLYAGRYVTSGAENQTSSNSVYLGYDTRASADGNTNEIVIGFEARGNGSNTATLGNASITTTVLRGNVGVGGITAPTATLHAGASTTARASICVPHGTAPTTPVDGDIWTTTAGLYVRINGSTVGPLS